MSESEAKPVRRWRKWLLRILIAVVVLCVVAALVLATGLPQRALLVRALSDALDAKVEVEGLSTFGRIRASAIRAADPAAAAGAPSKIELEGLDIDYTLFPDDSRYVSSVQIDTLAVNLDRSQPAPEEPEAAPEQKAPKKPRKKKKGAEIPEWLIPKRGRISRIRFAGLKPTLGLSVDGLRVKATHESDRDYSIGLDSSELTGSWYAGSREAEQSLPEGSTLDIQYQKKGNTTTIAPLKIVLPGLLEVIGHGSVNGGVDLYLDRCVAQDLDLTEVDPTDLGLPFGFRRLDLSGTHIKGKANLNAFEASLAGTELHVVGEGLAIGPQGAEVYEGDLAITGAGGEGKDLALHLDAELNRGQKLHADLGGPLMQLAASVGLEGWSRDDVLALVPKAAREGAAGALPTFQGLESAALDVDLKLIAFEAVLDVKPRLVTAAGAAVPAKLTCLSKGVVLNLAKQMLETKARAQIGDGSVAFEGRVGAREGVKGTVTLEQVNPVLWQEALEGRSALSDLDTRIEGTAAVNVTPGLKKIELELDLSASPIRYAFFGLPAKQALTLKGSLSGGSAPYWRGSGPLLELRLGDVAGVALRDWSFEAEALEAQGDFAAELDLGRLAAMAPGLDAAGTFTLHAPFKNENGYLTTTLEAALDGLVYGGVALPPARPLTVKGAISHDNLNFRGEVTDLEIAFGEGTALRAGSCALTTKPGFTFDMPCTFRTDFRPLVDLGLLDDVTGSAEVAGTLGYGEAGLAAKLELEAAADSMVLAGALAALEGASLSGMLTDTHGGLADSHGGLAGSGELKCAALTAAGATVRDIKGPVRFENGDVKSDGLQGAVFDGVVNASVDVGLLDGLPVAMTARLSEVNLATFSQEMAIPGVDLEGVAHGEVSVRADLYGLRDLKVHIESSEGFTVNLALLEQLLTSQYAEGLKGKEQVERVLAGILGKEGQRPFDSGKLTLALEGGRLVGVVELKSEKLDLAVDLHIDVAAVAEALRVAQAHQLENR